MNMRDTALPADPNAAAGLFVTVPETTLPGGLVVPAFQVSKFVTSQGVNRPILVDGSGAPLVNVTYEEARTLAAQAGFELIKESQALSLAYNLSQVGKNWTSGVVGEGEMYRGLHLDPDNTWVPYAFDYVSSEAAERREFYLADDSVVLDAAGNVYTWVFDDVQGDENGIVARAFAADSPTITTAPYPSMEKDIGWQPRADTDWSGDALVRGGCWCSGAYAGVFDLGVGWPDGRLDNVGFRCTKPIGL
jgi:formylglycine-generating enzyme required for sulfatase activity